jgi:parallel beta-helix repeat protein
MKYLILFTFILSCSQWSPERNPAGSMVVQSLEQLKDRIERAEDGEIILINKYAAFDLTYEKPIVISKRISLRGHPNPGENARPHFFSFGKPLPMFDIKAEGVVFFGLKLEGTEKDSKISEIIELNKQGIKGVYKFPVIRGIDINASNVVIKNCEIMGFSHSGIFIQKAKNITIEENYIHHNQRWGLGYGVTLSEASTATITRNTFNFNRHSIAGTGHSGQSYEAAYNWFGKDHNDTPLDMHGGRDRGDKTQVAGRRVDIHHNVILTTKVKSFIHRGIAEDTVLIHHNSFYYKTVDEAIGYYNGVTKQNLPAGKFKFYDNELKK